MCVLIMGTNLCFLNEDKTRRDKISLAAQYLGFKVIHAFLYNKIPSIMTKKICVGEKKNKKKAIPLMKSTYRRSNFQFILSFLLKKKKC